LEWKLAEAAPWHADGLDEAAMERVDDEPASEVFVSEDSVALLLQK
jgi:hypothetical protein